jgi:GRAM domain
MPRFAKTFLATSIPFGICMSVFWALIAHWPLAITLIAALLAGCLFGLAMAAFLASSKVQQSARPAFHPHEQIIKAGPANHFMGHEAVGGWLFLTDQRLVFKSHNFNLQNHELALALTDIVWVQPRRTAGIIPNGLQVQTQQGATERFVVGGRSDWCTQITATKAILTERDL